MSIYRPKLLRNDSTGLKPSKTSSAILIASLSAMAGLATLTTGCIEDTDCGICDPDNLILESISGVNYQSDKIHILNPSCEGDACPGPLSSGTYFIEKIIECTQTEEAQASADAEEYCRLSPLVTAFGIEFVFNNLLDPTSIELVRKRPDNPQLFEVYDWKPDVLQVEGPITRYNGDYKKGATGEADTITRLVNLSCIDNLREQGINFSNESYEDPATNPCNAIGPNGQPNKLFENGTVKAARGIWTAAGNSCSSPEEGPDTCCSYCEYLLSTKVERYGIDPDGNPRTPHDINGVNTAIICGDGTNELAVDKYAACAGFIPRVDRSDEEQSWEYRWCENDIPSPDCNLVPQKFSVPLFDKLRETHPDLRPTALENRSAQCTNTSQCDDIHDLPGTECMGTHVDTGATCLADSYDDDGATCERASCRPAWTVRCALNEDTTGSETAYCVDRRFATTGTAACYTTTSGIEDGVYGAPSNNPAGGQNNGAGITFGCDEEGLNCTGQGRGGGPLSQCDWNENGRITSAECCQAPIFGPTAAGQPVGFDCDPFYQNNLNQAQIYARDENLPGPTRGCLCPTDGDLESNRAELREAGCFDAVERGCYDSNGDLVEGREGQYAVKFVSRAGGIVYDPAIKGFDWRPADLGGVPRADIENCAENNTDRLVAPLNRHDGWRASDTFNPENYEDYDRAMCSGQEYRVVFNEPGNEDNPAFVIDKADNTLAGKSVYTFETAQFHVQPGSGFPTDNLRIGACDDFSLRFSNKYDSSPENMEKLQLFRVTCEGSGLDRVCNVTSPDPACDRANPPPGACCEVGAPVAGGPGCYESAAELEDVQSNENACAVPCLTVDIENQFLGEVGVEIDPVEFGQYLEVNETYRLEARSAATLDEAYANYQDVFWDACGMPLIRDGADAYSYEFSIDDPKCKEDKDNDGIPFSCDNADEIFNPEQEDIDNDGWGDVVDLCPVAGGDANNTADSDNDGVGNECDSCRQTLAQYNANAPMVTPPDYMLVRNIPDQTDTDEDGIGDVCDNCVVTPNCEGFGEGDGLRPYEIGDPIDFANAELCQRDSNNDMVGEACQGDMSDEAAGPVGLGDMDDFDQDGLANIADGCPRQPLTERIECTSANAAEVCGPNTPCAANGLCNHLDSDADGVGNACDTCPFAPNPNQALEGGMQDEDADGDFVGEACEIGSTQGCGDRKNARPFGFYQVAAAGNCCTTQLFVADEAVVMAGANAKEPKVWSVGDLMITGTCSLDDFGECRALRAPHPEFPNALDPATGEIIVDIPVRLKELCSDEQRDRFECAQLPSTLEATPGILAPPPGCEQALTDAGLSAVENFLTPLTNADFADQSNPFDALWQNQCFLPQVDQDYDGIGDPCDKCKFAFDPSDAEYVDANGRLWPSDGAACNGEFLPDNICEVVEAQSGGGGDTDTDGGSGSGGQGGSGSGG